MKKFFEKIVIDILEKAYGIIGKEISDEQKKVCIQFIGFVIVGFSNFGVNYIVYLICLKIFGLSYLISNVCAYVISVFNAFYWNNKYVFSDNGDKRNWFTTLIKTYISYSITGLFLTEALLYIEIDILSLSDVVAPVINLFITTPINFVLNKLWTFKNKKNLL